MFTFLISAAIFFLIGGCIFHKSLKQHQFHIVLIVFIGTLISTSIVNGVMGLKLPYTYVEVKEKVLTSNLVSSEELKKEDTVFTYNALIEFDVTVKKNDDTIYADVKAGGRVIYDTEKNVEFHYLSDNDTIPRIKLFRQKRLTDSKWVIPIALPRGKDYYEIYIPNDSIHNEMIALIERYWGSIKVKGGKS